MSGFSSFIAAVDPPVRRVALELDRSSRAAVDGLRAEVAAMPDGVPVGTVISFAGGTPPVKWLEANGAAVSRTEYAALFAVVGTLYGAGDESTTFNLPDLTNRVAVGHGSAFPHGSTGGSRDAVVVAHTHGMTHGHTASSSNETHSHSINHTHASFSTSGNDGQHGHALQARPNVGTGAARLAGGGSGADYTATFTGNPSSHHSHTISVPAFSGSSGSHSHSHTVTVGDFSGSTGSTGVSAVDANMPPYLALRAIIKVLP